MSLATTSPFEKTTSSSRGRTFRADSEKIYVSLVAQVYLILATFKQRDKCPCACKLVSRRTERWEIKILLLSVAGALYKKNLCENLPQTQ